MIPVENNGDALRKGDGAFATTHWSVVLSAGDAESPRCTQALETLCRAYWYPLYAHVRSRGFSPEEGEDLTQEFIRRLLASRALGSVHPAKGRFRSFLLAALHHFLANEWDKARALKRGGGKTTISMDAADTRYGAERCDRLSPDRVYERQWALTLLEHVSRRLGENYQARDRRLLFDSLQVYLSGEKGAPPYRETAEQLGMSVEAVKKAVERLRERYGELLRDEIAQTVSNPAEVDEEIRHLRSVLSAR